MQDLFSLKNKVVLVTGASSGIGGETARSLANQGAQLILTGRDRNRLNSILQSCANSQEHKIMPCELSNDEDLNNLVQDCPLLDGLVYSAGVVEYTPFKNLNSSQFQKIFGVNYLSAIQLTSGLLKTRKINKHASLVYISSISSILGVPGTTYYGASKAALDASVRVLASEVAGRGIRVNSIQPGIVRTPMIEGAVQLDAQVFDEEEKKYPLGLGRPVDVAGTVVFLLSDASRWMTGSSILLDGGFSLM